MFFCRSVDSLEHTFQACSVDEDFYYEIMICSTMNRNPKFNMTKQQILFNDFTLPIGSQHLMRVEIQNFHNTNEKVYL